MRWVFARFGRTRPRRRIGVVLALVALLTQLALPGAAALAMGDDPLGAAPICTTTIPGQGSLPASHHGKAVHAACSLCQAPSVAWGFLPPPAASGITGPHQAVPVVWRSEASVGAPGAVACLRARGPPVAA